MRQVVSVSCALLALIAWRAVAQPSATLSAPEEAVLQKKPDDGKKPTDKKPPDKKLTDPPQTDLFTQAPRPVSDTIGFNPHMLGDFVGAFARQQVTVTGTQTITVVTNTVDPPSQTTTTTTRTTTQTRTILVPVASTGIFKVSENESPRPQDRLFFTFNYFSNLRGPETSDSGASSSTQTTTARVRNQDTAVTTQTVFPNANVAGSLSREMIGFEKTFLGGFASLELRMPVLQQNSPISGVGFQGVGDLSVIGRYAFFLDPQTGNVMSAGLAITAPTGRGITTTDGTIHSTILQPWLGYIWNFDAIFVHAFHSVVLPSDGRDITLLFNDAGVSWWAYRAQGDAMLGAVVPTFEAHVTTPLNHRNMTDPITTPDVVVLTAGVHLLFGNTSLTLGLATPVTGPRVFTTETFVQLNRRF